MTFTVLTYLLNENQSRSSNVHWRRAKVWVTNMGQYRRTPTPYRNDFPKYASHFVDLPEIDAADWSFPLSSCTTVTQARLTPFGSTSGSRFFTPFFGGQH